MRHRKGTRPRTAAVLAVVLLAADAILGRLAGRKPSRSGSAGRRRRRAAGFTGVALLSLGSGLTLVTVGRSAAVNPRVGGVTLAVAVDVAGVPASTPPLAVIGSCVSGGSTTPIALTPPSTAQFVSVSIAPGSSCSLSHALGGGVPANGTGTADVTGAASAATVGPGTGATPTTASFTAPSSGTVSAIFSDAYSYTSLVPLTVTAAVTGTDPGPLAPFTYLLSCGSDLYTVPPLTTDGPAVSATVEIPSGANCSLTEQAPATTVAPTVMESVNGAPQTTLAGTTDHAVPVSTTSAQTVAFTYGYPWQVTITEEAFTDDPTPVTPDQTAAVTLTCNGQPVSVPGVAANQSATVSVPSAAGTCTATQASGVFSGGGDNVSVAVHAGLSHSLSDQKTDSSTFNLPGDGPTYVTFADVENPDSSPLGGSVVLPFNLSLVGDPPSQAMPLGFTLHCMGQPIAVPSTLLSGTEGAGGSGQVTLPVIVPYFAAPANPPSQSCSVTELVPGGNGAVPQPVSLTDVGGQDSTAGLTGTTSTEGPLQFVPNNSGAGSLTVDDTWNSDFDTVANVVGSQPGEVFSYKLDCGSNGVSFINLNTPAEPVAQVLPLNPASQCTDAQQGTPATVNADLSGPGPSSPSTTSQVSFNLNSQFATGAAVFTNAFAQGLAPTTIEANSSGGGGPFGYTITCGNASFVGPTLGGGNASVGSLELPASSDCVAQETGAPASVSVSVSGAAAVGANNGTSIAFETPAANKPAVAIIFSNFAGPTVAVSVTESWVGTFNASTYTFDLSCAPSGGSPISFGLVPITLTQSPVTAGPSTVNVPANALCTLTQSQGPETATEGSLSGAATQVSDTGNSLTFSTSGTAGQVDVAFANVFGGPGESNGSIVIQPTVTGTPPGGAAPLQYTLACTVLGADPLADIPLGGAELVHFISHGVTCTVTQGTNDGAQSTTVTVSGAATSSTTSSAAQFTTPGGENPFTVTAVFDNVFPTPPGTTIPPTTTTSTTPSTTTTSTTTAPTTSTTVAPTTPTTVVAPPPPPPCSGNIEVLLQTVFAPKPTLTVRAQGLGSAPALPPPSVPGVGAVTGSSGAGLTGLSTSGPGASPGGSPGGGASGGGHPVASPALKPAPGSPTGRNVAAGLAGAAVGLLLLLLILRRLRRAA